MDLRLKILRSPDSEGFNGGAPAMASEPTNQEVSNDSDSGQPNGEGQDFDGGQTAQPEKATAKTDGQRLRDIQSKAKDKDYRFSNEELDLIERADNGEIDEDESPEPIEPETPKSDPVQEALKEVGAKTPEELAAKIKDLKKFIGSRDAQAYKALEQNHQELSKKAQNHQQWIVDLQAGRPEAIQYLQTVMGPNANKLPQVQDGEQFFDPDEFISPEAGQKANQVIGTLKQQVEALQKQLTDVSSTSKEASEYYRKQSYDAQLSAELSNINQGLATIASRPEFREYFAPKSGTVQDLLNDYWKSKDGDPVDPRIQPIVEVFEKSKQLGIQNPTEAFEAAARILAFEKMNNRILGAEQRGVQRVQNAKRSIIPAATGAKTAETNYSESDVQAMAKGKMRIPEKWFGADGDLDLNKIPAGLRHALA